MVLLGNVPIEFKCINSQYKRTDKIRYIILNNDANPQFIGVALEANFNNGWHEIVSDIARKTVMVSTLYILKGKRSKLFVYDLNDIDKVLFKQRKLIIRMRANYRYKIDGPEKNIYSRTIIISE